jgi:hypothetical protein
MLVGFPAIFAFALALRAAEPSVLSPSLTADLDGDGTMETARATAARGSVRLEILDDGGRLLAEARAPAPPGAIVPITLTSAPLGSPGALVVLVAATDAMSCRTVWRYHDRTLASLPIRDAAGKELPACAPPGGWTEEFRAEVARPSVLVRERVEKTSRGALKTREVYAFAGFSLDFDPARSSIQIEGIPIPSWYGATFYTRGALETLSLRYGLAAMQRETTLHIEADAPRGIFALRFDTASGRVVAPVEAYSKTGDTVTLAVRTGDTPGQAVVRLGGAGGRVPLEIQVQGLGNGLDQLYTPASARRNGAHQVFATASDELASEELVGLWTDSLGKRQTIAVEGDPPYRVRMENALYRIDLEHAAPPMDILLLPEAGGGRPWGLALRGANSIERIPLTCSGEGAAFGCRKDGDGEILRRVGARVNVR